MPMTARFTFKSNQSVYTLFLFIYLFLVFFDPQPTALRVPEKESTLEWDYKYNSVGREECLRREHDRDVCPVETGRSEIQKQGKLC